jgi:hypothetical protein
LNSSSSKPTASFTASGAVAYPDVLRLLFLKEQAPGGRGDGEEEGEMCGTDLAAWCIGGPCLAWVAGRKDTLAGGGSEGRICGGGGGM